jgi:Leucine-rich repeat (LRR) protein
MQNDILQQLKDSFSSNNYASDMFKALLDKLFVDKLYDFFSEICQSEDKTKFINLISSFLNTSSPSAKISDLNELIRISIFKKNDILLKELLSLLIELRSKTQENQSMSNIKEAIIRENFLTLIAEYDETGNIFDILDSFELAQFGGSEKDDFYKKSLQISALSSNHQFLEKILIKMKNSNEKIQFKNWINDALVKKSAKNLDCFKIIYETDEEKFYFGKDILKFCLDNQYIETFSWMLNRFEIMLLSNEQAFDTKEFNLLIENIKWEFSTNESIYNTVLYKAKNTDSFIAHAAKILEKIFELESKAYDKKLKQRPLFFSIDNENSNRIVRDTINLIIKGNFLSLVKTFVFYYKKVSNLTFNIQLMNHFFSEIFKKKFIDFFFKILNHILLKDSNYYEDFLNDFISKLIDPINTDFLTQIFENGAHSFFRKYRHSDNEKKNILHLAAISSNQKSFKILSSNYIDLLNVMDKQEQTPLDLLIQRSKSNVDEFFFTGEFVNKIIDLIESKVTIKLNQESLISICRRVDDRVLLKTIIENPNHFEFTTNSLELDGESPLDVILNRKVKDEFSYDFEFLLQSKIFENPHFKSNILSNETFRSIVSRNNSELLRLILHNSKFKSELNRDNFEVFLKQFAKNLECFKVIFEFDSKKELFGHGFLRDCIESENKQAFLWLLEQFEILFKNKEFENPSYKMILNNVKHESLIFNVLLKKSINVAHFSKAANEIFMKIFNLELVLLEEGYDKSLIFPMHIEREHLINIEKGLSKLIFYGKFGHLFKILINFFERSRYSYFKEFLIYICDEFFKREGQKLFFEMLESSQHQTLFDFDSMIEKFFIPSIYGQKAYDHLSKFKILELNSIFKLNKIIFIPRNSFQSLTNLVTLNLSNNNIEIVDNDAFKGLCRLEELILSKNKLSKLAINTFNGLSKLKTLDISFNRIEFLNKNTFTGLTSLKILIVSWNSLCVVTSKLFGGLPSLENLNLSCNQVLYISKYAFASLKKIKILNLSSNFISKILPNQFQNLESLEDLYLNDNEIQTINQASFENLSALKQFSVVINNINKFDFRHLKNSKLIESVDLSNNSIDEINIPEPERVQKNRQIEYNLKFSRLKIFKAFNNNCRSKVELVLSFGSQFSEFIFIFSGSEF